MHFNTHNSTKITRFLPMSIDLTQATIAIALFYTYGSINKAISTSIDLTSGYHGNSIDYILTIV